jgi:sugar/nucleoside kinase (ribokinase family)
VTSWGEELPLGPLENIPISNYSADASTTFENIYTSEGRIQVIHSVAEKLDFHMIPDVWRGTPVVHLGPVAQEVEPSMIRYFPSALIGVTPQGWMRAWDQDGQVFSSEWPEANFVVSQAAAVVMSVEDVEGNEGRIEEIASNCQVLAVTEAAEGTRLYWHGDVRRFRPPQVKEVDATGAGDVFAAAFFFRLHTTRDPWEAARFATQIAAYSVTRPGLEGIPTPDEVAESMVEVF